MAIKIRKKKDNKDIIKVDGVEYKRYKRSKDVFYDQQEEDLELENRKHKHFLTCKEAEYLAEQHFELENEIARGK